MRGRRDISIRRREAVNHDTTSRSARESCEFKDQEETRDETHLSRDSPSRSIMNSRRVERHSKLPWPHPGSSFFTALRYPHCWAMAWRARYEGMTALCWMYLANMKETTAKNDRAFFPNNVTTLTDKKLQKNAPLPLMTYVYLMIKVHKWIF